MDITNSFAKVEKEIVIAACNNCLEDDKAWRKKSRDSFVSEAQKPRKVWKFWPFYYQMVSRTPEEAEEYTQYLESLEIFDNEYIQLKWKSYYGNPRKAKPLLQLAKYSNESFVYLSASDAEFVKSWE